MLAHFVIGFALVTLFGLFAAEMSSRVFFLLYSLCLHTSDKLRLIQSQLLSHVILPDSG